jgi:NAD-dependent oxidoreductase involved in siderophore biosynthesis
MPFVVLPTKAKNDAAGFQHFNNIKTDLDYLKTQTEVLVAEDATVVKDQVIPAASLKAATSPVEGASPVARAALTGGQAWESIYQNPDFWAFQ